MNGNSYFSTDWYRVAGLRPRLLEHVRIERHRYHGEPWYVLQDTLTGTVHRLTPAACLFTVRLDGRRTVDDVWTELTAEMESAAPGQGEIIELLVMLHRADLIRADVVPDTAPLLERRDRNARQVWVRNLRGPISMQIPVFDPGPMLDWLLPLLRPLLGSLGALIWFVLVITALVSAGQHWRELTEGFVDRVFAANSLLGVLVCYPIVKALHEIGHGIVARYHGCPVREMGVSLIVLYPVPYVDASPTAALPSKWARAHVAAAGILVELLLAAVAMHVWDAAEIGTVRLLAFSTMLIGGVSTLLVNGNPLLRFDGYYVLSDLIEVPNLARRSAMYLGHLADRYLFRLSGMRDFAATRGERAWMLVYGPLSWAYRIGVLISIAIFLASSFFFAGVLVALLTLITGVAWPVSRMLCRIAAGQRYRPRRARAASITFGSLAVVTALVLLVPVPLHTTTEGVVWLPERAIVRAGTDGFIRIVHHVAGDRVVVGQPLITLEHPIAEARARYVAAHVDELRLKLDAEWATDRPAGEVTRVELAVEEAALAREWERARRRVVAADGDGVFQPIRPVRDLVGRYVKEGEILGYDVPDAGRVARIVVPQSDIALVRDRLEGIAVRLGDQHTDIDAAMAREIPMGKEDLPHAALATIGGGRTVTDPREGKALKALERVFQFDLELPASAAEAGFGSRVHVRFSHTWEPLGSSVWRRIRQAFLKRFDM
jgi:putative peptide zinc metalloprotease protein